MRILIDIGHPGHVHLFRPFALAMISKGHQVLLTCREKEFEIDLLKASGFNYVSFGRKFKTAIGKMWGLVKFDFLEWKAAVKFKPDVFISHGSPYAAHAAWLTGKPHISMEDTFNFEQIRLYKPFTKVILTSTYNHPDLGEKNIKYAGYHELAYLHPDVFTPDPNIISELGLKRGERYVILRFVSWNATHDIGHNGISLENKIEAVSKLSQYTKVFISSEKELPEALKKYQFPLQPGKMHHAIAFSSLVYGESATMATEAAVLGVPAIYLDNTSRFYTKEIENKYGLIYNFSESEKDQLDSIEKAISILEQPESIWKDKRKQILNDNINVTAFLTWFVENYPESKNIMKGDPAYHLNFK